MKPLWRWQPFQFGFIQVQRWKKALGRLELGKNGLKCVLIFWCFHMFPQCVGIAIVGTIGPAYQNEMRWFKSNVLHCVTMCYPYRNHRWDWFNWCQTQQQTRGAIGCRRIGQSCRLCPRIQPQPRDLWVGSSEPVATWDSPIDKWGRMPCRIAIIILYYIYIGNFDKILPPQG